jgi:hypothetical protein
MINLEKAEVFKRFWKIKLSFKSSKNNERFINRGRIERVKRL